MDLGLTGKPCIVTGASSGIGLAVARALGAEGAPVLLVGRRERALSAAAAELGQAGAEVESFVADVTAEGAAEAIAAACADRLGPCAALVNNAGSSRSVPLEQLTEADWQEQWEQHVLAPLRLMRAIAPAMAERGWGRVVNVCSSSGKRPSQSNAAYSVTKAAELSLSRVFADSYAGTGVLVNAVAPGPIETPLWIAPGGLADQAAARSGQTREQTLADARKRIPRGRFGTAEEVAAVVAFLCSEAAGNVLGAAWSVDGGAVPLFI